MPSCRISSLADACACYTATDYTLGTSIYLALCTLDNSILYTLLLTIPQVLINIQILDNEITATLNFVLRKYRCCFNKNKTRTV